MEIRHHIGYAIACGMLIAVLPFCGWAGADAPDAVVTGVVQVVDRVGGKAGTIRMLVESVDGGTEVVETKDKLDTWRRRVDCLVAVRGGRRNLVNPRGEIVEGYIESSDISVLAKGCAEEPFSAPTVPLDDIWVGAAKGRMRKVSGVVTWIYEESGFFIQEDDDALFVKFKGGSDLRIGDHVEVAGFPRMASGIGNMVLYASRRTGEGEMPRPVKATGPEMFEHVQGVAPPIGRLVSVELRMLRYNQEGPKKHVFLCKDDNDYQILVIYRGETPEDLVSLSSLQPRVRVTGVCEVVFRGIEASGGLPRITSARVLIRDSSDVEVLPDAAYEARRMKGLLASLGLWGLGVAVLALAVAGVKILRDRARMGRVLAVVEERKRMADDLHDTLEQHFSGAAMLLTSVSDDLAAGRTDGAAETLDAAAKILLRAKSETRETIWNLRHDEIFDKPPAEVLADFARDVTKAGAVRVRRCLRGTPARLPPSVMSAILFIGQEAVTNAVKHGRAKNVLVAGDPSPDGFTLRFANDGLPFDGNAPLGPEAGHFGLSGMRERAHRAGIGFSAGDEGGRFTVTLKVDRRVYGG